MKQYTLVVNVDDIVEQDALIERVDAMAGVEVVFCGPGDLTAEDRNDWDTVWIHDDEGYAFDIDIPRGLTDAEATAVAEVKFRAGIAAETFAPAGEWEVHRVERS